MGQVIRTKDRIHVSYDRKINVGNYESVGVGVGYSTDIKKGETPDQACDRAEALAAKKLTEFCEPIEGKRSKKGGK